MKQRPLLTLLTMIFAIYCVPSAFAVEASPTAIELTRADESAIDIVIDGVLDEAIWLTLAMRDDMVVVEPDTLAAAPLETRTRFLYTEKGLYIGIWNEQAKDTLVSRLSSRDRFISRDGVAITLDPGGKGLYGYWFSVNLGGTLLDGTVLPERQYSNQWDGPWQGAAAEHEQGWAAEFFIPWSMMTMPESDSDTREMSYYISRAVAHKNERWGFPGLPSTGSVFLSKMQKISLKNIKPKQQFTFYPYASSLFDNTLNNSQDAYKAGFDIFWRPSSNLQVSSTINPDFGNVESDNVVVNLSSFETFFPEKRAFFLEGQEIFVTSARARQGRHSRGAPTTLLNTRRIGSAPKDTGIEGFDLNSIEANQPTELKGAGKLTGQYGKFRYGFLSAFEEDTKLHGLLNNQDFRMTQNGRNFGVARILYEDTSTGARRSLGWISTAVTHSQENAIVHGLDAHYLSPNGRWNSEVQIMRSDVNDITGQGGFFDITYSPLQGRSHKLALEYFDDTLDLNDFGFLRRNDSQGFVYSFDKDESGLKRLKSKYTGVRVVEKYNTEGKLTRSGFFFSQRRSFKNNAFLFSELNYFPARWEDRASLDNGDFRINQRWQSRVVLRSDESRKLSYGGGIKYQGEDVAGGALDYDIGIAWRPNDRFSLVGNLTYEDRDAWLIHHDLRDFTSFYAEIWRPSIELDYFLSAKQQFRITAQWAGIKADENKRWQVPLNEGPLLLDERPAIAKDRDFNISRLTFQARYRWELAPLSDLFVVYTRGSNVDSLPGDSFGDLIHDSWTDALVDSFVVKLRYRLGG